MTERTTTHLSDEAVQNIISTVNHWSRHRDAGRDNVYMMRLWNIINDERENYNDSSNDTAMV